MKNIIIIISLISCFCGCTFKKSNSSTSIPKSISREAEKKFGVNFNKTRMDLGLQPIPNSWKVVFNEDYSLYFASSLNTDSIKGYVFKKIEYNDQLEILTEEDYYRRKDAKITKLNIDSDCDDDHLSFIYDFKLKEYSFDSFCCTEWKNSPGPWENTKEGYHKQLESVLSLMGYQ